MGILDRIRHAARRAAGGDADVTPARDPFVLHASPGRLRVHLPHWSCTRENDVVAAVRRLGGVTHAEISPITGNLLVRYAPPQTSAQRLLEALPGLRLEPLPPAPAVAEPNEVTEVTVLPRRSGPVYVTGMTRVFYQGLGWASVGLAVVGAITPGIPTAPFVVLAGYFFIRSSPEAHQWLRRSRWFGPILRDWEDHRAVRRSVRNAAIGLIFVGMAVTLILGLPPALTATIITLELLGLVIVMSLPVIDPASLVIAPAH